MSWHPNVTATSTYRGLMPIQHSVFILIVLNVKAFLVGFQPEKGPYWGHLRDYEIFANLCLTLQCIVRCSTQRSLGKSGSVMCRPEFGAITHTSPAQPSPAQPSPAQHHSTVWVWQPPDTSSCPAYSGHQQLQLSPPPATAASSGYCLPLLHTSHH